MLLSHNNKQKIDILASPTGTSTYRYHEFVICLVCGRGAGAKKRGRNVHPEEGRRVGFTKRQTSNQGEGASPPAKPKSKLRSKNNPKKDTGRSEMIPFPTIFSLT